jgi:hypothetical protein
MMSLFRVTSIIDAYYSKAAEQLLERIKTDG